MKQFCVSIIIHRWPHSCFFRRLSVNYYEMSKLSKTVAKKCLTFKALKKALQCSQYWKKTYALCGSWSSDGKQTF